VPLLRCVRDRVLAPLQRGDQTDAKTYGNHSGVRVLAYIAESRPDLHAGGWRRCTARAAALTVSP
jgi:hypothetical protein